MIKGKNIGAFHTRSTARSDTLAYAWRSQKRGKLQHPGRGPVESSDRREGGSADSSEAASHAGSVAAVSAGGKGGDGLYQVRTPHLCAGFVVEDGQVTLCAPILRRKLLWWRMRAIRIGD